MKLGMGIAECEGVIPHSAFPVPHSAFYFPDVAGAVVGFAPAA